MTSIRPELRVVDGLNIRYAEGQGGEGPPVLLLSPWPESLYAWEAVWNHLEPHARLLAIDLPGFGQSEGREALFSPRAMGAFLLKLVDEWQLELPHVFAPDVGTGATLFAAARAPGRLASAVVGSGGTAYPLEVSGGLKDIIDAPDLGSLRALDSADVISNALTMLETYEPSEEARRDYLESYAGDRFAESARFVRNYPADLPVLRDLLPGIETPVQIIAGRRDPLVPPRNAEYLHELLPHSRLAILNAGHFVWEDRAEEWAAIALEWIDGGYEAWQD
jgi:pimeloyl-ACP methyl ester carboxylesterase